MNEYRKYLYEEQIYANKFLKYHQIIEDRFDEDDYSLLKSIWEDINLINRIYEIIDDIILKNKLEKNLRFIIIGDFLFSLSSFDLRDPSELILKTSRDSYLYRIKLRALINVMFNCDLEQYIVIHQKLLIGLRGNNVLKRTQIRSCKKGEWSTVIYFSLEIKESFLEQRKILGISNCAFIVIDIDSNKYSIASFRNIWKIKRKKREMVDFLISYNSIIKANQIGFILSSSLYKLNLNNIEKEKIRLLDEVSCNSIDDYFLKVKKILRDNAYSARLVLGREQIDDVSYYDCILLKRVMKEECINLISRFQRITVLSQLSKINFDRVFYLPCFMDNRGRQYYATLLSPTFHIIFRNLYEFEIKKDFVDLYESEFYKKIMKYCHIIRKFNLEENEYSYTALVLFIEVGKFFMKNNDECHIKTEKIIELGIKNYELRSLEVKYDDSLYLNKIFYLLDKLILESIIEKNSLIFKDATASGLQNYGILLGYKEDRLRHLNIDNDDWCDTYQYIINKYLGNVTKLTKRKYWKKTLMTIPYNASWYTCFKDFMECLRKDGVDCSNFDDLKNIHQNFYNTIKKDIKKEFFVNDECELVPFQYNKYTISSYKDYKINYDKLRDKYRSVLYTIEHDPKSTEKALEANNMHYLDAELVKHLLESFEILTIHDSFAIRICELPQFMDTVNKYYSKKIGKYTYSIHIII